MLIADASILIGSRWYSKGEALPGDSPLVSAWIKNKVAHFDEPKKEAKAPEPIADPEPVPQEEPEKKVTKRGRK